MWSFVRYATGIPHLFCTLTHGRLSGVSNSLTAPSTFRLPSDKSCSKAGKTTRSQAGNHSVQDISVSEYQTKQDDAQRTKHLSQGKQVSRRKGAGTGEVKTTPRPWLSLHGPRSRFTEIGHIVLTIGYALLISTTLIRCGGHAKIFAHS
jgi:hypothetical protein